MFQVIYNEESPLNCISIMAMKFEKGCLNPSSPFCSVLEFLVDNGDQRFAESNNYAPYSCTNSNSYIGSESSTWNRLQSFVISVSFRCQWNSNHIVPIDRSSSLRR
ncbi:uncharacterized protein [Nicotiana tomentosiformis]|uniref:uncharacterized protein n=1 Tax=Nicotiana tomentosiformis TaxID=4098 RepID=UPI000878C6FF|nr:uncharacterized protein LOC108945879 [Nicotiana tomentosiformis]